MTARKTHWLRTTLVVLIICGLVGLGLTCVQFFGNPTPACASATLQFTFDGAASGIAPNGAAFDISAIASDEVLTDALETASLTGTYTPEQLRNGLVVRGAYPEDMASQVMNYESLLNFTANRETTVGDYHPTTFSVALYDNFDESVSAANLEALLKGVLDAYKAHFARVYANGLEEESLLFDLENYDYPQQLEIIQGHLETVSGYAQEMYERKPAFRLEGLGFNDVSVRLNNLINSDIARLNADLTINALTRDTGRLLTQYQFEIRDLSNQLGKQQEQLDKLDTLIASYDKNEIIYLSTTDSLTKIDGNSSETYDALVETRKEVADGITGINSQIAVYQLRLSDLMKDNAKPQTAAQAADAASADAQEKTEEIAAMTEEEIAEATAEAERLSKAQKALLEKNISNLVAKGKAVIADYKAMLDAYNAQEINDMTVAVSNCRYSAPKLLSGAFIKKAIKTAGPLCALGFMLCMILIIRSRRKESRA